MMRKGWELKIKKGVVGNEEYSDRKRKVIPSWPKHYFLQPGHTDFFFFFGGYLFFAIAFWWGKNV